MKALIHGIACLREAWLLRLWRRQPPPQPLLAVTSALEGQSRSGGDIIDYLCSRLSRAPYWRQGHVELARAALNLADFELCYDSIKAAQALSSGSDVLHLLGKFFLAQGRHESALAEFSKINSQLLRAADRSDLVQDSAAALLALGRKQELKNLIAQQPRSGAQFESLRRLLESAD